LKVNLSPTSAAFTYSGPTPVPINFQVEGTSLKLFVNGVLEAYGQDTALTTGSVGIFASAGQSVSNFSAAVITPSPAPTTPFSDNFGTPVPNQLSNNWVEQVGNYTVAANKATGVAAVNIATLYGYSTSNSSLAATINLTTLNQTAGLISNYS